MLLDLYETPSIAYNGLVNILSAAEMADADRRTVELGTPIATLMENAGAAVARFCLHRYARSSPVLVLAGKGNNGGDGLVAARHLAADREVHVVLLGSASELKGEAAAAIARLRADAPAVKLNEVTDEAAFREAVSALPRLSIILDAIVGTGFKPPLRGLAAVVRDWVAPLDVPVVAVDVPSGWDADSIAETALEAFRADSVVTFTSPKLAHVFGHVASPHPGSPEPQSWPFGPVVVADIGSPAGAIPTGSGLRWAGSAKALTDAPRPVNANKGKFGHVLVVGGSYGTAGAPSMSSLAALRTGAGLVTAAVPRSIADTVALTAVELMLSPVPEGPDGALGMASLEAIQGAIREKRITTLAVGPGLSTRGEASTFVRELVARTSLPAVIDADGLNAFAGRGDLLSLAATQGLDGGRRTVVLTPHPGEMARLTGLTIAQVESDRVGLARRFATEHGVTLVLKGWRTLVAHPNGQVAVNTTGNPSMAKGGSGDILTGIVAATIAQYPADVARAVEAAVFLHGLAGDLAARRMDQHSVLATDTLDQLSAAFRYRLVDSDGFTWISGIRRSSDDYSALAREFAARRTRHSEGTA